MAPLRNSTAVFRRFLDLQQRHWRRRGPLGPSQVMIGLMTMSVLGSRGYEQTMDNMKEQLGSALGWADNDDAPTASAFCQARRKLPAQECERMASQVYDLCTIARAEAAIGYDGMRLLAEDGTKLPLPAYAVLRNHFGCPSQGEGRELDGPQASLTVLWDVGANQPVTWRLGPYLDSERAQANGMMSALRRGDLLLCDRNFMSRRFLTQVHQQHADVLLRVCTTGIGVLQEVREFVASDATDQMIDVATRDEHEKPLEGMPCIRVRLIRNTLPDGSSAVYLTTLLDQQQHPAQRLIDLYAQRWRIETAFREMKVWHGLEHFRARHVDGIAQEVAAIMIFLLLAGELEAQVRATYPDAAGQAVQPASPEQAVAIRPTIRFNRRIVADCAVKILRAALTGTGAEKTFAYAMRRIWRYRQTIKPGRSFPRQRKSSPRGWKPRGTKGKGRP